MEKEIMVPGSLSDFEKYLIQRLDATDARIEKYFKMHEEKITGLRMRFAAATVVIALATTIITDNIRDEFKQPAIPVNKNREAQSER